MRAYCACGNYVATAAGTCGLLECSRRQIAEQMARQHLQPTTLYYSKDHLWPVKGALLLPASPQQLPGDKG